ncbi:hypothetical protein BD410DRAFT_779922 [Rickenella mellea]|uniref:Uncharacterized protein n=1 Tax=Rickenella mellea TaxID=50990 RepID=A0A4R5XH11_9AGAM|nr:hypothetical protein BD410DRAFT_779922 [Rickenella mellea]
MDRYLAPNTPEAQAHLFIKENSHWEDEQPSVNETLIAFCASYAALARYVSGEDIYLMPRNAKELEATLWRYSHDAIHNTIAYSKSPLQLGGYSRICHIAEQSIGKMLSTNDNAAELLALHRRVDEPPSAIEAHEFNRPVGKV